MSTSEIQIENSVLWGSPVAVAIESGTLTVTNSVLDASGVAGRIYLFSAVSEAATDFHGDYNCYRVKNGALIAEQRLRVGGSLFYSDMPAWISAFAEDRHSMAQDPRFANEITGEVRNLSFEREFGQIIGRLDLLATFSTERYRRAAIDYVQGLVAAPFLAFLPVK